MSYLQRKAPGLGILFSYSIQSNSHPNHPSFLSLQQLCELGLKAVNRTPQQSLSCSSLGLAITSISLRWVEEARIWMTVARGSWVPQCSVGEGHGRQVRGPLTISVTFVILPGDLK